MNFAKPFLIALALFALAVAAIAEDAAVAQSPTVEAAVAATVVATPEPTEQAYEADEYTVRGTRLGGSATKMDIPIRDVPGSVSVITDKTLKQQNANDWVGAMRNIAGAMPYRTYGGFTQAVMRGLGRNDLLYLFDGVRDAATVSAGSSSPQANNSMENIDRVEVLKGPQAMLYGQGAVAGVINSIRKKPSSSEAYEVSFGLGQYEEWRVAVGAQGKVLGSGLSYRMDLGLDDNVGFRKAKESRALASLALGLSLWDGAELNLYSMIERDRYMLDVGIPLDTSTGQIRPGTPLDRRYNTWNDFQTRDNAQYLLEFLQGIGSWQLANRTSYMPNEDTYLAAETLALAPAPSSTVTRAYLYFNTLRYPWMNNLELSGKFKLLGEHKVLVGHEYQYYRQYGLGFQAGFGPGLPAIPSVDLYNPVDGAAHVGAITPNRRTVVTNSGQAVYAQNYWTVHEKAKVLVGGRYDSWLRSQYLERLDQANGTKYVVETYSTTTAATAAPVYKAGLVFGSFFDTTFYIAQGNSYFPNFKSDDAQGRVSFDPETGEMLEGGLKYEGLGGRLAASAAVFDIFKHNILNNPAAAGGLKNYAKAGTLRSTGAEFDLAYRGDYGSSLQLGYAYTDASYYSFVTDPNFPHDKTKNFSGNRIPFVPMHSATLWATRYMQNGFGLGLGGRHTSDVYTQEANQVVMQGYTIANAAVYYKLEKGEFQVNIDNIFDKRDYFVSSIRTFQLYPGEPRTVSTRYTMKF